MLLSAVLNATSGLLTVDGNSPADQVVFALSGSQLNVTDGGTKFAFTNSAVKSIQVTLGSGADSVFIPAAVVDPATLTAGSGPDTISGGGGDTTLVAGSGNDSLVGNGPANDYVFSPQSNPTTYTLNQAKAGQNRLDFTALPAGNSLVVNTGIDELASYNNVTVNDAVAGQYIHFNQIYDGQGDDTLSANNGGDTIVAGDGSDYLYGGTGADLIRAGNGYDVINGNGGADTIYGGAGKDVIYTIDSTVDPIYSDSPVVELTTANSPGALIYCGSGPTSVVGGPGPDTIYCGSGDDTVHGMGGSDSIVGGSGNDVIFGDSGNVTITAGTGNATIASGSGMDTVYGGTTAGATTFIDKNIPDEKSTAQDGTVFDTAGLTANALAVANGTGTPTYPLLGATGPGDIVPGDIVLGNNANTTIIGGAGNDTLRGGNHDGIVIAGTGNDLLIAGDGNAKLYGGAGSDTLAAGNGPDLLTGGTGDSIFLNLNGFPDTIVGGSGQNVEQQDPTGKTVFSNVQVTYTPLNAVPANAGLGVSGSYVAPATGMLYLLFNDTFNAYGDNTGFFTVVFNGITYTVQGNNAVGVPVPVVQGKSYKYTATGLINNGTGTFFGPQGNTSHDSVSPFTPVPSAPYGSLVGVLKTAATPAVISPVVPAATPSVTPAPTPSVTPVATPAVASVSGATVSGGVLHVGSSTYTGPQTITLGQANGVITVTQAGAATQTFSVSGIKSVSVVTGPGDDNIYLGSLLLPATVNAGNGNNTIIGGAGNETLTGGSGDDTILGGPGNNDISGGAGNNILYGGTGNDILNGGPGSDWIYPGAYGVSLYNDTESDTINGGTGTEKLDLAGNADPMTIDLSKGAITDRVTGAVTHIKSVRNIWAGAGNDLIVGATAGGILLNAGSGNDTLFGISQSDIIYGGVGDDQAFLDGNQGYIDLLGNHDSTPGNTDQYNQGQTIIPPSVDASDLLVALQKSPG